MSDVAEPEKKGFQFPSTMTVLILVTLLVWIAAFLIPSGTYEHDETGVPTPGSYREIASPQDFGERVGDFFLAPVNGLYGLQNPETGTVVPFGVGSLFGAVGVFMFVLAIGAFMTMVLATGALDVAIGKLAYTVQARPWLVIVAVMGLFSLLGTTMGWADETLGFYALLIPLLLTLGYDRITAAGMIIASATVGAMASTVNPFSIGVASEFADVGIGDGIGLRWIGWFVLTAITIAYVVRYAQRVKAQPERSLVGFLPEDKAEIAREQSAAGLALTGRQKLVLGITAFTFALLVFSVIPWDSIIGLEEADPVAHETVDNDFWWNLGWWFPRAHRAVPRRRRHGRARRRLQREGDHREHRPWPRRLHRGGGRRRARPRRDGDPQQHADDRHDPELDGGRRQRHVRDRLHVARLHHQHGDRVHHPVVVRTCHAGDAAARSARRLRRRGTAARRHRVELGRRPRQVHHADECCGDGRPRARRRPVRQVDPVHASADGTAWARRGRDARHRRAHGVAGARPASPSNSS
jgi:hypothetical protein